eukprot:8759-Heterococcus_DN1.PRE.5
MRSHTYTRRQQWIRCRSSNDLNHFNTGMETSQCNKADTCSSTPCKPSAAAAAPSRPAAICTNSEPAKCDRPASVSAWPKPRSLFKRAHVVAVPPSPTGSTTSTLCLSDDDRSRESSLELEPVKKVTFFPMVSLVLIPTRHELSRAQKESMWFTTEEIQEFRWECYLNSKRVENQARIAQALATAAATSAPPCTSGVVLTSRRRAS